MNDTTPQQPEEQRNKGKSTPQSVKAQVLGEIKEAKLKTLKSKIKALSEEMSAAEAIVKAKKQEIEDALEDNADLFS